MSPQTLAIRMWAVLPCSRIRITRKPKSPWVFSNLWATEWLGITVPMV